MKDSKKIKKQAVVLFVIVVVIIVISWYLGAVYNNLNIN